jgi:hypothetical protein
MLILWGLWLFLPFSCFCCVSVCVCQLLLWYSLITCLVFSWGLIISILSWLCLFSSSTCRIPFRIFSSSGQVVMYCFHYCLSWKIFVPPLFLTTAIAVVRYLGLVLLSFSAQYTSIEALLVLSSQLRNLLLFWWSYLYMLFDFAL